MELTYFERDDFSGTPKKYISYMRKAGMGGSTTRGYYIAGQHLSEGLDTLILVDETINRQRIYSVTNEPKILAEVRMALNGKLPSQGDVFHSGIIKVEYPDSKILEIVAKASEARRLRKEMDAGIETLFEATSPKNH